MRSRRIPAAAFEWAWPPSACPMPSSSKATDALVEELRAFSPIAQRTAKKLLNDTEDSPLSIAIELEGPLLLAPAQLGRLP